MDRQTQTLLNRMTAQFYREQAASFSATRQAPWDGWRLSLEAALGALGAFGPGARTRHGDRAQDGAGAPGRDARDNAPGSPAGTGPTAEPDALTVLDVACGNLRYERFLADALPDRAVSAYAVDAADGLASQAAALPTRVTVRYQHLDIVGALIDGVPLASALTAPPCHLAVAFGFLHHIPGSAARAALLDALLERIRPGGCVIVSLWQFMNDERLARKARAVTAREAPARGLALEENDYLLGWQDAPGALRYCHHFPDHEIDQLLSHAQRALPCRLIDRFSADGKTGNLNAYLVLQCIG